MSLPPASMPASTDKTENRGIALCLSGGGFRASLFHLGALRRLHELGLLRRLDALSSVSGGSIFSAFLATAMVKRGLSNSMDFPDWENDVAKTFREFTSHDIRTLPVLLHCLWNWIWPAPRLKQLESTYHSLLTSLTLAQLPERPRFILCATDLAFGVNWEFGRGYAGDYQVGYSTSASSWPLARAVAASSSFPPIFGPMRIRANAAEFGGGRYQKPDRAKILSRVALSDGGVYDNMGLEPVWKNFHYVLISDCGAPFSFRIGETPWSRLLRYTSVLTKQTGALRLRSFFNDIRSKEFDGTHWSLTQSLPPGAPGVPVQGSSAIKISFAPPIYGFGPATSEPVVRMSLIDREPLAGCFFDDQGRCIQTDHKRHVNVFSTNPTLHVEPDSFDVPANDGTATVFLEPTWRGTASLEMWTPGHNKQRIAVEIS